MYLLLSSSLHFLKLFEIYNTAFLDLECLPDAVDLQKRLWYSLQNCRLMVLIISELGWSPLSRRQEERMSVDSILDKARKRNGITISVEGGWSEGRNRVAEAPMVSTNKVSRLCFGKREKTEYFTQATVLLFHSP